MADNWRVLDFTDFEGAIGFNKNRNNLVVYCNSTGEIVEQSIRDINIIFLGIKVALKPATVYHLTKHDVVVLFCDWKGLPVSGMYPWINAHGRVSARQRAQASMSLPRMKNAWMRIVKSKIKGSANNLETLGLYGSKQLKELALKVKSGDPSNIEAQAAKLYWRYLFQDSDFRRIPEDNSDNRNALLNYGYTILRGHSMRAVLSAGLTPALGLHHCNRANSFALADDLIEPFRPAIDVMVYRMRKLDIADRESRLGLLEAANATFSDTGETVPTVMRNFAQQFGNYAEGSIEILQVPVWKEKG